MRFNGIEIGGMRIIACLGCLILLKVCESWIAISALDSTISARELELPVPIVTHPRCDACRYISLITDSYLREADEKLLENEELTPMEVDKISKQICKPDSFRDVKLISWNGDLRLSLPLLETKGQGTGAETDKDWAKKLSSHCRYLLDKMKGIELYDLWLRAGHRNPVSWLEFMCIGEGVFGDCLEEHDTHVWPWEGRHTYINKEEPSFQDRVIVNMNSNSYK